MSTKTFKNTEILYVIDAIAREKSINSDELFAALEEVIKSTAKMQYGTSDDISVKLDKKTGKMELYRKLTIVSNIDYEKADDKAKIVALDTAKKLKADAVVDDVLEEELPPLDMSRMSAYIAKKLIVEKLKELEINRQYDQLKNRVGEIVLCTIRTSDRRGATVVVEGIEGYIPRSQMLRGDNFKIGDRMKAYLVKIEKGTHEVAMTLSRTHNDFLSKLIRNEVPEIQDGLIEIKAIVRDPGSKAKVAVYAPDKVIDAVGSCIGVKGSRIQSVISELCGERIDVVRWSPDIGQYIINCFYPIQLLKVFVDEESHSVDIEAMNKDLSAVIGRQGQNIRLISRLTNMNINLNRHADEGDNDDKVLSALMQALDIDDLLAHLLISEGYKSPSDIMHAGAENIGKIEGLDEVIAQELVLRASENLANKNESETAAESLAAAKPPQTNKSEHKPEDDIPFIINEIKHALHHAGVTNLQSIAEMSVDELQQILKESNLHVSKENLTRLIMNLREKLFFNIAK